MISSTHQEDEYQFILYRPVKKEAAIKDDTKIPIIWSLKELKEIPRVYLSNSKLTMCIATKWRLVQDVAIKYFRWKIIHEGKETKEKKDPIKWDIQWLDGSASPNIIRQLQPYQRINRFPESGHLGRKNLLSKYLKKMKKLLPTEFDFFPETWLLPLQFEEIKTQAIRKTEYSGHGNEKKTVYIVKPEAGSCGRGIYLCNDLELFANKQICVVQEYISNPYLIDNLKFDLRIYVLLRSVSPMRLYIYREGMARFATKEYQTPCRDNFDDLFMHLTNYSLNKHSPDFQKYKEADEEDAHKRSLTWLWRWLKEKGEDPEKIFKSICDVVNKTMITFQPHLEHSYRSCQMKPKVSDVCFELLGFDIMLDEHLKPYVIEINRGCSLNTDSQLDKQLKENLLLDTLNILNLKPNDPKKNETKKDDSWGRKYHFAGTSFLDADERKEREDLDKWEEEHAGGYVKIFPPKESWQMTNYNKVQSMANFMWDGQVGVTSKKVTQRHITSIFGTAPKTTSTTITKEPQLQVRNRESKSKTHSFSHSNNTPLIPVNQRSRNEVGRSSLTKIKPKEYKPSSLNDSKVTPKNFRPSHSSQTPKKNHMPMIRFKANDNSLITQTQDQRSHHTFSPTIKEKRHRLIFR